ncbi:VOC family protein [Pantoea sp. At-9b]|uniref:VOC family protein n=1 Tax=Pantoea sp. (strain At-9b) TaxID=592316 RepID=UPI0001B3E498|nr:VOC family protein [Pantoea sp. At-9b]ADU72625.1 Glyoxalase/bleomycin resistance protein/dioxygenase [Pantoea sp. At-9b]
MFSHMRIAKPVTDLERSFLMYRKGLGFKRIADFTDHDGFSGIMLGIEGLPWHIELTLCRNHPVKPLPTEEDLFVLYYPDEKEWGQVCANMLDAGFVRVNSFNPYWDANGRTFRDIDGYRVVIQNQAWG